MGPSISPSFQENESVGSIADVSHTQLNVSTTWADIARLAEEKKEERRCSRCQKCLYGWSCLLASQLWPSQGYGLCECYFFYLSLSMKTENQCRVRLHTYWNIRNYWRIAIWPSITSNSQELQLLNGKLMSEVIVIYETLWCRCTGSQIIFSRL